MPSDAYAIIKDAILRKKIVVATYNRFRREMCPHVIGHGQNGAEQALFYQFAGESSSGLGPAGSRNNWRCIPISGLTNIEIIDGEWHSAPNHSRPQTCVKAVDVEVDY